MLEYQPLATANVKMHHFAHHISLILYILSLNPSFPPHPPSLTVAKSNVSTESPDPRLTHMKKTASPAKMLT